MITEYMKRALAHASVERLEDGTFFATIAGLEGLWADGETEESCRQKLGDVLQEWLVIALREDEELPEFDGVNVNFGGKRWSGPLRAGSSSGS